MAKINIICDDVGWIYTKFISMFYKYSKHQIFLNSKNECNVTHYLPYYMLLSENIKHPCTAWMSHQEQKKDLYDKFIFAAKNVDLAISQSKKYLDILKNNGVQNIIQIMPGVDLSKFILRSKDRQSLKNKLIVGYVGRQYNSSDRKNPKLLQEIAALPFVELKVTGGLVKECQLPQFYCQCDIVIQTSTIEGGSMAVTESLACGVPILCYEDVGVANEFGYGVIRAIFNNSIDFIAKLISFWEKEEYNEYRKEENMQKMRGQIVNFTWENFVIKHDEIWNRLLCGEENEKV